ncbi:extracellular solute-binding protein [Leucobacter denitrificans]|uniref:Extracellular solute-binding protein n=1 Tax=Leucobacter denitrificans TaxID=683042 RepID=A0A7G9S223_9MICO|nr:extracellular solute-binding protein [Leucobacter denitrificans]QNN61898.1 extracellular solute-binding protein [Leucobacter denitrificans]
MKSTKIQRRLGLGSIAALGLAASLGLVACSSGGGTTGEGDENGGEVSLVIASWGDPFTSATMEFLAEPFMAETGYDVQIVDAPGKYVASLEAQNQANNVEWDLLDSTSAPDAYIAYDKGLVQKMPDDVKKRILEALPEDAVTDFGITWSILGYTTACNADAVTVCPQNTTEMFDTETFPGSRTSISTSPLVNLSLAEIASGVDPAELANHEIDMDRAFAKLEDFKAAGGTWWNSGDQYMQILSTNEVDMGIGYSGRSYAISDEMGNLEIHWDQGLYNPGFWNVVEGSENSDAAWEFVEWIATHPEAAANWGQALGYSVPNPESFDYIDADVAKTLADYPENRELLGGMNFNWYVENYQDINDRWQEFLRG